MIKVDKDFIEYVEQIGIKLWNLEPDNFTEEKRDTLFDIVACFSRMYDIIEGVKNEFYPKDMKEFIEYADCIEYKLINFETKQKTELFDIVQCFASMKKVIKEQKLEIITQELTFEDVKKIANENGFELRQYGDGTRTTLYKSFPMKELKKHGLKKPLEFNTLKEVINFFSPF